MFSCRRCTRCTTILPNIFISLLDTSPILRKYTVAYPQIHDNRRKRKAHMKIGGHSEPVLRVIEDDKLRVAIVGRPNVGKSTLFNAIVGRYHAIADKMPGVTRDCQEGPGELRMRFKGERMIKKFDIYSHELGRVIELTVVDTPGADNIVRYTI